MDKKVMYLEELIENTCIVSKEKPQLMDKCIKLDNKSVIIKNRTTKLKEIQAEIEHGVIVATQKIREQKENVEKEKIEIEEAHKKITDSLSYAKRIQNAILPSDSTVKKYLNESFILYKPKDIVAGDFYWIELKDENILFAVADCTGHGVPGALVSIVCNNALNRSVREYNLSNTGKILDKVREIIVQEFEKAEEDVKDGMDIALCSINGNKLEFSGANNPLYLIRKAEDLIGKDLYRKMNLIDNNMLGFNIYEFSKHYLFEFLPDKQPVGICDCPRPFGTLSFDLKYGDSIYLFSDGFADQFGGARGKKYKSKLFRDLLISIQDKSMTEQLCIMDKEFEAWKGNLEQVDDVCILGVKFS